MAEAARTAKHYVSDSLAERYPYDARKGFAGARQKDSGAVFNGYDALGLTNLINSLTDPSVTPESKAKAAHHLYSRSASQETKVEMLLHDIVPLLAATLRSTSSLLLQHECLLLLRSLTVLPQGCFAVVFQGGLEPAVAALETPPAAAAASPAEAERCRTAAAHVVAQVSSNVSGLRWMLGVPHETAVADLEADPSVVPMQAEDVVGAVVAALGREEGSSTAAGHLLRALAHVSSQPRGVQALLAAPDSLAVVERTLQALIGHKAAPAPEQALGESALEVVWNVALDRAGERPLQASDTARLLFAVFAAVSADVANSPVTLQRQLMGALSAIHQLTAVKLASLEEMPAPASGSRIAALVQYVRQWSALADERYHSAGAPVPSGVVAIVKNAVQCVRLASEVKPVRTATHALLDNLESASPAEAFSLRRQLYFGTPWEVEYRASMER